LESAYAGVKQRWVVVYSPEAYQRAITLLPQLELKKSVSY
jgi:hypothetical protein